MTTLTVYIPADERAEALLGIKPGSAIVGSPLEDDPTASIRIDYEGNLFGAINMNTDGERMQIAAGRHIWNNGKGFPTVARQWVEPALLCAVATYDTDTRTLSFGDVSLGPPGTGKELFAETPERALTESQERSLIVRMLSKLPPPEVLGGEGVDHMLAYQAWVSRWRPGR